MHGNRVYFQIFYFLRLTQNRCGSGCLITFLGQLLKKHNIGSHLIATDINPAALIAAKQTGIRNEVTLTCLLDSVHLIVFFVGVRRLRSKFAVKWNGNELWQCRYHDV